MIYVHLSIEVKLDDMKKINSINLQPLDVVVNSKLRESIPSIEDFKVNHAFVSGDEYNANGTVLDLAEPVQSKANGVTKQHDSLNLDANKTTLSEKVVPSDTNESKPVNDILFVCNTGHKHDPKRNNSHTLEEKDTTQPIAVAENKGLQNQNGVKSTEDDPSNYETTTKSEKKIGSTVDVTSSKDEPEDTSSPVKAEVLRELTVNGTKATEQSNGNFGANIENGKGEEKNIIDQWSSTEGIFNPAFIPGKFALFLNALNFPLCRMARNEIISSLHDKCSLYCTAIPLSE